jgi:hypothetical protein
LTGEVIEHEIEQQDDDIDEDDSDEDNKADWLEDSIRKNIKISIFKTISSR